MVQPSALNSQTAVLVLADFAAASRFWGWLRIVKGPSALQAVDGLRFAKVLGSGYEGGFGLRPSGSRQGLFAVFHTAQAAQDFVERSQVLAAYRERCRELCVVELLCWSCRGSWDGTSLDIVSHPPQDQEPIAALTRASIHVRKASAFWQHATPSQNALGDVPGLQLAVGLGEAPFLRQATFTIWDSVAAMDAYARTGAHLQAIQSAGQQQYFSESMFARFILRRIQGQWKNKQYG
jgi:heme-degrading monooxygenase HmoA